MIVSLHVFGRKIQVHAVPLSQRKNLAALF
jgi:hypothetical protein